MTTVDPDILAAHAHDVLLFSQRCKNTADIATHQAHMQEAALGALGNLVALAVLELPGTWSSMMTGTAGGAKDLKDRIEATAKLHHFTEQVNTTLMQKTKAAVTDPDFFHAPQSVGDIPDMGMFSSIASFAAACPTLSEASPWAVALGAAGLAMDVLGYVLDPVAGVFGAMAGIIVDLAVPLKKILDLTLGDPAAISTVSTAWSQIAKFLATTGGDYSKAVATITPKVWNEPGASDVYLKTAKDVLGLVKVQAQNAETISEGLLMVGSALGDARAYIIGEIMSWLTEMIITAAAGAAAAPETLGASIAAAMGFMEAETAAKVAALALFVGGTAARLGAAAIVAHHQSEQFTAFTAKAYG